MNFEQMNQTQFPSPAQSRSRFPLTRKQLLIGGIVLVAIVLAATGLALWLGRGNGMGIIQPPSYLVDQHNAQLQKYVADGTYDKAVKADAALSDTARTQSYNYEVAFGQGMSYEAQSTKSTDPNLQKALAAFQNAAKLSDTSATSYAIARVAERMSNKQLAIDSYTKALSQLPTDAPNSAEQAALFQNKINGLK